MNKSTYRPDIDGLRAVAVILVVGFHAFPQVLPGGFIGVDIFFVISGYLISKIIFEEILEEKFHFSHFYSRRIKRIFPALILVLLTCFGFAWFNLLADEFKQLGKHMAAGAGFISNLVLWGESGYFDGSSESKPLLHLWSLGVEEQFYLLWPVLIWFAWKKRISLFFLILVIGLGSLALNLYFLASGNDNTSAFYLPQSRFWELMCGAFLAYVAVFPADKKSSQGDSFSGHHLKILIDQSGMYEARSIAGFILIIIGVCLIDKSREFPGLWALLPVVGAALVIGAGGSGYVPSLNKKLLSHPMLVWIGLISFPLYLWHWPLLSFAHIISGDVPSLATRTALVGLSFVLATLTYYCFERPMRFWGRSILINKLKLIFLVTLMAIIGFLGFNTYQRNGLSFRLNQIQFRLPPVLQALSIKDPKFSALDLPPQKIDCSKRLVAQSARPENCWSADDLKKPSIYLWGDSYAAHLSHGYEAKYGSIYRIQGLFYNGCPPILNMELPNRKNCTQVNQDMLAQILLERPDRLVIAANWTDYDWARISGTLDALKKAGVKNIDLIGPAPQWKDSLYKQLYLNYLENGKQGDVPERMSFGLNQNFFAIEPKLKLMANSFGVNYISIVEHLCNAQGCLTRFGDTSNLLESVDGGHFTKFTSDFVVHRFPGS